MLLRNAPILQHTFGYLVISVCDLIYPTNQQHSKITMVVLGMVNRQFNGIKYKISDSGVKQ